MKTILALLIGAAIAGTATWFITKDRPATSTASSERQPLFYQSAMHPWIKSDKPGRCTICGMELTPVYEGEAGFEAEGDVVPLSESQVRVLNVRTDEAKVAPLMKELVVAGMIDDDATRHRVLSAYVAGRIEKLYVNYVGTEVEEGQPLADFYSPGLLQAEREYRQLSGQLKDNAALRLRQMGLDPGQVAELPDKPVNKLTSEILSPIGGTVVAQHVYEGQYVTEGEKLLEIADFSTMWFMFRAYEQDMPWIKTGQTVIVTTPATPGQTFKGKITFIDPNFDEMTRSTNIRVELPNPLVDGRRVLPHRIYADGAVKIEIPEVLSVPRTAILETGPEAVVYVEQNPGAYERKVIKTGRRGEVGVEVLSGLEAGDRVVTQGNLLIDGQAEMNRSYMATAEPSNKTVAEPLSAAESDEVTNFLATADAMAKALSSDDLAAFNEASALAMKVTGAFTDTLKGRVALGVALENLNNARHFHGFDDLATARAAFLKFTVAATAVFEGLRGTPGMPVFQEWECGMVNQAIPDAIKKARWLQLGGRPGHNPFFGAEMLECAKEIQP